MKNIALVLTLLLFLSLPACSKKNGDSIDRKQSITVSGAFALYPLMVSWAEGYETHNPGVTISVSAGGAGKGMADTLGGLVDIGMISREIYPEEISQGAWPLAVAEDGVLGIVNTENPVLRELKTAGITPEKLNKIWSGREDLTWGELTETHSSDKVRVYTRSDACGAAAVWGLLIGKKQEEFGGTGVFGDPGIVDAVRRDPLGIGYGNVNFVYDINSKLPIKGIAPLPIDFNADGVLSAEENCYSTRDDIIRAIVAGAYPSPPSRILYLVCRGKPEKKALLEFLAWILEDGQLLIHDSGYIPLSDEILRKQIEDLGA